MEIRGVRGMMERLPRSRLWVGAASSLAALALVGVGYAAAGIPGPDGVIHACYDRTNGNLRVVPSGTDCRTGELPLQWNQVGP